MNKSDLINAIAAKSELSKADANRALNAILEIIENAAADGESVSLAGFGTFEPRDRPARTGRNPKTGEPIEIAAAKSLAFVCSKSLRDRLNAG